MYGNLQLKIQNASLQGHTQGAGIAGPQQGKLSALSASLHQTPRVRQLTAMAQSMMQRGHE